MKYQINIGSCQPYVVNTTMPEIFYHFGPAVFGSNPILSDANRVKAQKICDRMNENKLAFNDAKKLLDKIK